MSTAVRIGEAMVVIPIMVGLGWVNWAAATWLRYGHQRAPGIGDALLDPFIPRYEVSDRQERIVDAPAATVFKAIESFRMEDSRIIRVLIGARGRILRAPRGAPIAPRPFLDVIRSIGWGTLVEVPGREFIFGAVTQPWKAEVLFRPLTPARFAAFDADGYARIAWTIAVDSLGPRRSRVRTETRVATTDPDSRERFRRYWAFFSPGISLIRYAALRAIGTAAEHESATPATPVVPPITLVVANSGGIRS